MTLWGSNCPTVAQGASQLIKVLERSQWGELFIETTGNAGTITYEYVQTGWSREAEDFDSEPIVPWNFYYWPSQRGGLAAEQAKTILTRFGEAFGHVSYDPGLWEQQHHQSDGEATWEGHCHWAAIASAVFEQPKQKKIKRLKFSEEEMEFLSTEFIANFIDKVRLLWRLAEFDLKDESDSKRPAVLYYLKPGQPKTRDALATAIAAHKHITLQSAQATAATLAAGLASKDFSDGVNIAFGHSAGTFFTKMLVRLRQEGNPLVADMRSYFANRGPEEVWNQVYFYFQAEYTETVGNDDEKDLTINCRLHSNNDTFPSQGFPAKIRKHPPQWPCSEYKKFVVVPNATALVFEHQWRLMFDPGGSIAHEDPRCQWISAKNSHGEEMYAPDRLNIVESFRPNRPHGVKEDTIGNPAVGKELVADGYVRLRRRYKSMFPTT